MYVHIFITVCTYISLLQCVRTYLYYSVYVHIFITVCTYISLLQCARTYISVDDQRSLTVHMHAVQNESGSVVVLPIIGMTRKKKRQPLEEV